MILNGEHLGLTAPSGHSYHLIRKSGDPKLPTLFLLHGFMGQVEDWEGFISSLSPIQSWVAIDLLGHGQSSQPEEEIAFSPATLYKDISFLWAKTCRNEIDIAIGYSMGGRLLLGAALNERLQPAALVLIGSHFGISTQAERITRNGIDERWATILRTEGLETFIAAWYRQSILSHQPPQTPAAYQTWNQRRLNNNPRSLAACILGLSPSRTADFSQESSRLKFPTILLSGQKDNRYTHHYKERVEALPRGCHHIIPEAGHSLHIEAPAHLAITCQQLLPALPR